MRDAGAVLSGIPLLKKGVGSALMAWDPGIVPASSATTTAVKNIFFTPAAGLFDDVVFVLPIF